MAERTLEGGLRRKVERLLAKGAEPEEIAALLVRHGWEPGQAQEIAEREDRLQQDRLRDKHMGKTHAPRSAVRTGGSVAGILFAIWVILKLVQLIARASG